MYYIISLKHTAKSDKIISLWRPDNSGYCMIAKLAGIYEKPIEGYHDSEDNIPILVDDAKKLFQPDPFSTLSPALVLLNNKKVHEFLGVKMGKRRLEKIKKIEFKSLSNN